MLKLSGTLCDRQRHLNVKVKETVSENIDFNRIKDAEESSDIDKIFKIDVAAESRNVDYIVEILKSGDPLHISRAIKRAWLYNNEFSNIINPEYLHQNVFPFMSNHMRRKFLTTIAQYITDENRAASFFNYCVGIKLNNVAYKFLIFTTESFKTDVLTTTSEHFHGIQYLESIQYLKHFVKNSFALAEILLEKSYNGWSNIFYSIRHLYSISDVKYLDLMEKCDKQNELELRSKFGLRLSKDIIKKHKDRVRSRTVLYFKVVNTRILLNHSTVEDVKIYLVNLLPNNYFWEKEYCNTYRWLINLIPSEERFEYIKRIFQTKYAGEKFETNSAFYNTGAYYLMTDAQKESWALQQIASGLEILGSGKDYLWYRFVNFDTAIKEIKRYIMVTSDKHKRSELLKTLVESAKNQRDIEKLLKYFYDRHINEQGSTKSIFIDKVIKQHKLYDFDGSCWTAFNKILYNLGVYNTQDSLGDSGYRNTYRVLTTFYHIIKRKDLPEPLITFIDSGLSHDSIKYYAKDLSVEEREIMCEYLMNFNMEKLKGSAQRGDDNEDNRNIRRKYIRNLLELLAYQSKSKTDFPELVINQVQLDWDEFKNHVIFYEPKKSISQNDLIRMLKKDENLLVEKLPEVEEHMRSTWDFSFRISQLMRKLKVYFSHDIAKRCLEFFINLLDNSTNSTGSMTIFASVHSIFQLADESFKVSWMEKYTPTVPKIDYDKIDGKWLFIQRAICYYVCVSRPPVPLKLLLKYIQGDYVHFCKPIFNSYLAHLPQARCLEFVESLLDQPVSIQKHGLRLAFVCFETDNLLKLVSSVWRRTKNVSLRTLLFQEIFDKMGKCDAEYRNKYIEVLRLFVSELKEDDDDELYIISTYRMPSDITGNTIEILWENVRKFPERKLNLERVLRIIQKIESQINLIRDRFIKEIVEETINTSFRKHKEGGDKYTAEVAAVEKAKWSLTAKYLTQIRSEEELELKLDLSKRAVALHLDNWNDVLNGEYVVRRWFNTFINNLKCQFDVDCHKHVNVLLETVLDMVQKLLPPEAVYFILWQLKLSIATRKVVMAIDSIISGATDKLEKYEKVREICSLFAKEVDAVVKDFIDKKLYVQSFVQKLAGIVIESHVYNLKRRITKYFCNDEFKFHDLIVLLCNSFLMLETSELHELIVHIVPYENIDTNFEGDYKVLFSNLKNHIDMQVRVNFDQKIYSDLKHRPYFDFLS